MTLEEAIKLYEEKSGSKDECSKEHRQIAEWLTELKAIKDIRYGIIIDGAPYEAFEGQCSDCVFGAEASNRCRVLCEVYEDRFSCLRYAFRSIKSEE